MARGCRLAAIAAALALGLASGAPAAGQIVCRPNVLGAEICMGVPAPTQRNPRPYAPRGRGLGAVQPPVPAPAAPGFTPAGRTDALGNVFLRAEDLPPRRPPLPGVREPLACRRDALGNLLCR